MAKNNKKKNTMNIVSLVIRVITIIATLILSFFLVKNVKELDMLPNKYFILFVVVLTILNIISVLCLLGKKLVSHIIGGIISILIIVLSVLGIFHSSKIINILDKAFDNMEYETTTYSIVVLKDSDYEKLEDLENKLLGYVKLDAKNDDYKSLLTDKISLEFKEYDNSYIMYEELTSKKIDAMIVDDIYLEFLEDEDSKIEKKIRVIYTFEVKEEIGYKHEDVSKDLKPFNILITGSDARVYDRIQSKTRSDVNMIMTVNPQTHEILLTSIPRDAYVQLHGTTGVKDKLTHSGIYGLNMTKTTIEDFMGIKFDYVVKVGFGTVINVVDTIGGIEVYSDKEFNSSHIRGWHVEKGNNYMDGKQALAYSRERYAYVNGDNHRVQNQQQVLEAIFTKVMTDKSLLKNYEEVLNSLSSLYVTDIPQSLVKRLVKSQLNDMKSWKIEKQQVAGEGKMGVETYSMPGWKLWVMIPYDSSVKKNSQNINDMINGKRLSELKLK